MGNIGPQKMFALVVDSVTKAPRRMIDTSGDQDDQYLLLAQQKVAVDETIILLPIANYPVRDPQEIAKEFGYVPADAVVIPPDPIEAQAVADMAPLIPGLSKSFKTVLASRIKELYGPNGFILLPRFDPKTRQLLAAELPADMADKLMNDAPEAPHYVRAVVLYFWSEVSPL